MKWRCIREVFFLLFIRVWLAQQTVSKGTEMCIDKMRCHFNDVLLAFYWQVYVYYLSMHSLSLIFYSFSLCCVSNLENALRSFSSIFCFDFFLFAGSSCGRFIQLIVRFGVDFRSFFNSNVFQCIYGHYSLYNDFITSLCFLSFSFSLALAVAWSLTVLSSSMHSFIQPFISIV